MRVPATVMFVPFDLKDAALHFIGDRPCCEVKVILRRSSSVAVFVVEALKLAVHRLYCSEASCQCLPWHSIQIGLQAAESAPPYSFVTTLLESFVER